MAVQLTATYSKKLGLPGYSSHSFSVTTEVELTDLEHVPEEASRLYDLLQNSVDSEIQNPGIVPSGNGTLVHSNGSHQPNGSRNGNGSRPHVTVNSNGNGRGPSGPRTSAPSAGGDSPWSCSDKQKELVLKLVGQQKLDRNEVEHLAQDRFGAGVRMLNKLQMSGLISELLESAGSRRSNGQNGQRKGATR